MTTELELPKQYAPAQSRGVEVGPGTYAAAALATTTRRIGIDTIAGLLDAALDDRFEIGPEEAEPVPASADDTTP